MLQRIQNMGAEFEDFPDAYVVDDFSNQPIANKDSVSLYWLT